MRSHTGDKPYKCQFCADQFARSDLLSRHVNKLHPSEKPISGSSPTRKKVASRATTSKQSCDQCVQSNSPCNGSNPCSQCTQRTMRCTFVKFHRQTAPIGPGHNPTESHSSSSRLADYSDLPLDPAILSTAPISGDPTSTSMYKSPFPLSTPHSPDDIPPPDLAKPSDFAKYQSQAEYIRRTSLFQPSMEAAPPTSTATLGWASGISAPSGLGVGSTTFAYPSISAEVDYASNARRLSMEFSSDSSASPSPTWSSVHLPVDISSQQHPYHEGHARTHSDDLQNTVFAFPPNVDPGRSDGEFSSALGRMSLEDPNALAEFSNDVASFFAMNAIDTFSDNPDSTPMPRKPSTRGASLLARPHPVNPANASANGPSYTNSQAPSSRDEELQALKDSWDMYLRTPLSGPDEPISTDFSTPAPTGQSYRRTRVSSMPTVQTPSTERSGPSAANGAPPPTRTTMHGHPDDLRLYEAAVLARRAPLLLDLDPRRARGATTGSTITSPCSPLASVANGGTESVRPSFKRLASRTLGPESAKRTMLAYDASDDDSDPADGEFDRREISYRCDLEQQQASQPGLQPGFPPAATPPPSSFGGLAGRRRMSVPAMRSTVSTSQLLDG
ncbi:hypothetical protein EYR38_010816 [Pleurotus pulmonarius]|nr:hypothetical protein EYR38_010816 [Pleurotus pulmonarius]